MNYIWEHGQWPALRWDDRALVRLLAHVSREQGRLLGIMEGLGFDLRSEAHLHTLTEDVVKTSEIEGERLEREQVRSTIARRLGMDIGGLVPADRNVALQHVRANPSRAQHLLQHAGTHAKGGRRCHPMADMVSGMSTARD